MGSAFGGRHGIFDEGGLRGHRAVLLISTGGAAQHFGPEAQYGDLDHLLFHIHHGMLAFVGYDVLTPIVTHAPARQDAPSRSLALHAVGDAFKQIDDREQLHFPRPYADV